MKSFALAFLVVIAGAAALPQDHEVQTREGRIVVGSIITWIDRTSQAIRDAGLDPVLVERAEYNLVLIPLIAEASALVESLEFTGLSNIAVNTMYYSDLLNRLFFDVSLPEIRLSIGDSKLQLVIFGPRRESSLRGSASVRQIRIAGEIRVNTGIISGITVRSLSINFSVGDIQSDVSLKIFGVDISSIVNILFNETIPEFLAEYENDINELLERIAWAVIERLSVNRQNIIQI